MQVITTLCSKDGRLEDFEAQAANNKKNHRHPFQENGNGLRTWRVMGAQ